MSNHGVNIACATEKADFAPPAAPWRGLPATPEPGGCLTIYYNDRLSRLPVREVTRPGDNKSDPNLETLTYGLFSTCGRSLRASVVDNSDRFLFFATNRAGRRVLSGYYDLGWYAESNSAARRDFCLAARTGRFIERAIPLTEVDARCGTRVGQPFRGFRRLTHQESISVKAMVDEYPDATELYLQEIHRLERFNLRYGGYRYIGWKQADEFGWAAAGKYLCVSGDAPVVALKSAARIMNSSPSNLWRCSRCERVSPNKSLLRRCPECGALATLTPMSAAPAGDPVRREAT